MPTLFPPERKPGVPLRRLLSPEEWRVQVEAIARAHGLLPCELSPFERGETVVWAAGEHVVKLTYPECLYQIDAEASCLVAVENALGVATPRFVARGELSGYPYVVMGRIGGRPIAEVWASLAGEDRRRLARDLGALTKTLHGLSPDAFPLDWQTFFENCRNRVADRDAAAGADPSLVAAIERFLARFDAALSESGPLFPLHTELIDQHVYVDSRSGRFELSGLLDFADARAGLREYEFSAPVEFIFQSERGLLREYLLGYGFGEDELDREYSERLLAFALCGRFTSVKRLLSRVGTPTPTTLEELAQRLFPL